MKQECRITVLLLRSYAPWQLGWSAGHVPGKHPSPTRLVAGARAVSSLFSLSLSKDTHAPRMLGC